MIERGGVAARRREGARAADLPAKLVEPQPCVLLCLRAVRLVGLDFIADVKSCVIPTRTIPTIASTTSISGSVTPSCASAAPAAQPLPAPRARHGACPATERRSRSWRSATRTAPPSSRRTSPLPGGRPASPVRDAAGRRGVRQRPDRLVRLPRLRRRSRLARRPPASDGADAGELLDDVMPAATLPTPSSHIVRMPSSAAARSISSRGAFSAASCSRRSLIVRSWKTPTRPR